METDGGGWTVFQRRMDGSVDFYRDWTAYEKGFGILNFEFWLGLSKIHRLTKARDATELQVIVEDFKGIIAYAQYSTFSIGDSSSQYTLTIGGGSGTANDSMADSNGIRFTTRDSDNDQYDGNCAADSNGAWWYSQCSTDANLNGQYYHSAVTSKDSVSWYNWKSSFESLKSSEMKLRATVPIVVTPPPPGNNYCMWYSNTCDKMLLFLQLEKIAKNYMMKDIVLVVHTLLILTMDNHFRLVLLKVTKGRGYIHLGKQVSINFLAKMYSSGLHVLLCHWN